MRRQRLWSDPAAPSRREFPPVGAAWRLCGNRRSASFLSPVGRVLGGLAPAPALEAFPVPRELSSPHLNLLFGETLASTSGLPFPSSCGDTYKSVASQWVLSLGNRRDLLPLCLQSRNPQLLINQASTLPQQVALQAKKHPFVPFL